jgi:hypothetical protein
VRKILKLLLIVFAILIVAYGVYFFLGRPAIPLPAKHFQVFEDNQLYPLISATGSDEITINIFTNGKILALTDDTSLVNISYTPKSFNNVVWLASKYLLPAKTQNTIDKINRFSPCVRILPRLVEGFFYHIIRFHLTFVFAAN